MQQLTSGPPVVLHMRYWVLHEKDQQQHSEGPQLVMPERSVEAMGIILRSPSISTKVDFCWLPEELDQGVAEEIPPLARQWSLDLSIHERQTQEVLIVTVSRGQETTASRNAQVK